MSITRQYTRFFIDTKTCLFCCSKESDDDGVMHGWLSTKLAVLKVVADRREKIYKPNREFLKTSIRPKPLFCVS